MRTSISTSTTSNSRTRRAPVATTLAAVCLAIPMAASFAGTAFASGPAPGSAAADGTAVAASARSGDFIGPRAASAAASTTTEKSSDTSAKPAEASAAKPAAFVGPVAPASTSTTSTATASGTSPQPPERSTPYVNQGGVTVGSNTNHYELASDGKGSTFTGVGGGQPSGDIHQPQPFSTADQTNSGANDTSGTNQYRSTRDGSPSLNGNGGGLQVGQPCAGCVGKADNKNPPGQYPNGTDANAGYECDRNHGIGRTNPAHTGCTAGTTTGGTTGTTTGGATFCPGTTTPMPANGKCDSDNGGTTTGGGSTCPAGSSMVNNHCELPAVCPAGPATMVNGQCVLPTVCPAGSTQMPSGACVLPISDTAGGPAIGGRSNGPAKVSHPLTGGSTPAAATAGAPAQGLPFTGSNLGFLTECALLMLLVGGGLLMATRSVRPHAAVRAVG